jgi:hypothetical protein
MIAKSTLMRVPLENGRHHFATINLPLSAVAKDRVDVA